ncbi:MAG TPA: class I SAM-dependent methyltransferase [Bryobacteraceae bacterium]|jgi:SAM-dependent methyltransferase
MSAEIERIIGRYERREACRAGEPHAYLKTAAYMSVQERHRALLRWAIGSQLAPLGGRRLLEIGCGNGQDFFDFLRFGFQPENLVGIELLPERAATARRMLPAGLRIIPGDALEVSLPPESFHVVYQSTVFTSILDADFQRTLAARMWDWVAPGGGILWYDFLYDNPRNPDVAGVPLHRIRDLFPRADMRYWRLTLAPPIARAVTRIHPSLYTIFNAALFLRTHVLCWIRKPGAGAKALP